MLSGGRNATEVRPVESVTLGVMVRSSTMLRQVVPSLSWKSTVAPVTGAEDEVRRVAEKTARTPPRPGCGEKSSMRVAVCEKTSKGVPVRIARSKQGRNILTIVTSSEERGYFNSKFGVR